MAANEVVAASERRGDDDAAPSRSVMEARVMVRCRSDVDARGADFSDDDGGECLR